VEEKGPGSLTREGGGVVRVRKKKRREKCSLWGVGETVKKKERKAKGGTSVEDEENSPSPKRGWVWGERKKGIDSTKEVGPMKAGKKNFACAEGIARDKRKKGGEEQNGPQKCKLGKKKETSRQFEAREKGNAEPGTATSKTHLREGIIGEGQKLVAKTHHNPPAKKHLRRQK